VNVLDGKIAVITGGGGGIGRATALEMARQGAKIVVTDVNAEMGEETARGVRDRGGEATFLPCDLRDSGELAKMIDAAADCYGGLDVLHNNAGLQEANLTADSSVDTMEEEIWDTVFDVNIKAVWLATKAAVPHLSKSKGASIINAASLAAFVAYPMGGAYAATKGAVVSFTRSSALDLAPYGIRVNCYSPAATNTPMMQGFRERAADKEAIDKVLIGTHLIPRLAEPEEIATLVCFLASDASGFITGTNINIDGGVLAWRGVN
jgi:NAD(P)-dependent dehydrogenase (short-subunit alcohol dehydrogenase family)